MKSSVHEKIVLVLNASSATGLAQSLYLRRKGYRTIGLLEGSPRAGVDLPFEPILTSVSEEDSLQTIQKIMSSLRRLDAVISWPPPFLLAASDELQDDEIGRFLSAHLIRILKMETLLLQHMRAAGGGKLINIVSAPAQRALSCLGLYQATQAAIRAWSEATSRELASVGVFISVVECGRIHGASAKLTLPARPLKRRDHDRLATMEGLVAGDRHWVGDEILVEKVERILQESKPKAYYAADRTVGLRSFIGRLLRLFLGTGARGGT
ncbi:SDR family NAD(P)-dependent oxidoreductase [Acidisarcina polymorpha]